MEASAKPRLCKFLFFHLTVRFVKIHGNTDERQMKLKPTTNCLSKLEGHYCLSVSFSGPDELFLKVFDDDGGGERYITKRLFTAKGLDF